MRKDSHHLNEQSRSDVRAKRRKTNKILNTMIVLVLFLIVFVSIKIFFQDDEKTADNKVETVSKTVDTKTKTDKAVQSNNEKEKKNSGKKSEGPAVKDKDDSSSDKIEDKMIVTDGGNGSEVKKTMVNPAWQPVGTAQTGGPAQDYNMDGVDWQEMVKAITYATGIDESNMIIEFLGNNGPKKSVATIKQKDTQQLYRVYIEWIFDKGWKPTLVEEIITDA